MHTPRYLSPSVSWGMCLLLIVMASGCNYRNHPPGEKGGESTTSIADSGRGPRREVRKSTRDRDSLLPARSSGSIRVSAPAPDERIETESFRLAGRARTFENALSYRLIDSNGSRLSDGHLTAKGEMGDFNPYSATVHVGSSYSGAATLEVFDNSPKDGSEIGKVRIPLHIHSPGSGKKFVQVFFTNGRLNRSQDCEKVYGIGREYDEKEGMAEQAIAELLQGPSDAERKEGYATEIPSGTKLRSIRIADGVASVDFSRTLTRGGGACHMAAVHSQIESTLHQFPSVKSVVISAEGDNLEMLQP